MEPERAERMRRLRAFRLAPREANRILAVALLGFVVLLASAVRMLPSRPTPSAAMPHCEVSARRDPNGDVRCGPGAGASLSGAHALS